MKTLLLILISFIAVTATLSGLVMITNPGGDLLHLQLGLLKGTPFKDFQLPGILLTAVVGGINLVAVFYNIQRHKNRYNWALAAGFVISGWIIVQLILIQVAHWLHFIYLGMGILIILLAYQLKGKWAV
ncbi:MAG: hypothetical protein IPL84_12415 [Chitinophagaceae bacterium]|nr:hypothetical protein [Chitinophagaceae bacterium]